MEYLKVFFAVTTTSAYRIEMLTGVHVPVVEKIAMAGQSDVPVGQILQGGCNLGIMNMGLILYDGDRELPEMVNTAAHWFGLTSAIVGLFLKEEEAIACLGYGELTPLNPRWRRQTEETLEAIGPNHPKFVLSEMHAIRYDD